MKQYIIGLVRLTAAPVALPKSTNAQSQAEMHHLQARESAEAREGIAALNEKRKPNWSK
jgi:enoyl-CoA hydratase/carnithine racemase